MLEGLFASCAAFVNEICSKYTLGKMQTPVDSQIVYLRLGMMSPAMHLHILVTLPLALHIAQAGRRQPLALWYAPVQHAEVSEARPKVLRLEPGVLATAGYPHTPTSVLLRPMAAEWLLRSSASLRKEEGDTSRVDRADRRHLMRIGMQNSMMGLTLFSLQNPVRALHALPSGVQRQRIQTVRGTERVSTTMDSNRVEKERKSPRTSLPPMPSMALSLNARQDIVLRSHRPAPTSIRALLYPDVKSTAVHHTPLLSIGSEQQTVPASVSRSVPNSPRQAGQPIPKEGRPTGEWQPIADAGLVPLRYQKLGVSTVDSTVSTTASGVVGDLQQLTVLRPEARLEPPSLHYAYVPPRRPAAPEEHVVAKVPEKEVVKAVHKEVQALMSSGSLTKYFSRDDYTHIADSIYSSLARRLLVEKERLGIR